MTLLIKDLQKNDYGSYTCAARNSLNTAEGSVMTYAIDMKTDKPATELSYEGQEHLSEDRHKAARNGAGPTASIGLKPLDAISSGKLNKLYKSYIIQLCQNNYIALLF